MLNKYYRYTVLSRSDGKGTYDSSDTTRTSNIHDEGVSPDNLDEGEMNGVDFSSMAPAPIQYASSTFGLPGQPIT